MYYFVRFHLQIELYSSLFEYNSNIETGLYVYIHVSIVIYALVASASCTGG